MIKRLLSLTGTFLPIVVGGVFGLYWLHLNLSLPPAERGLQCCDAGHYAQAAQQSDVYQLVHLRTFGYPVFLHQFFRLYQYLGIQADFAWVTGAAVAQFTVWIIGATTLLWGLRRTDGYYPRAFLGIALAHPALASYAALTLTDVLATALFCLIVACTIVIQSGMVRLSWPCIAIGICFGLATTLRPSFQIQAMATSLILVVATAIQRRDRSAPIVSMVRTALIMSVFFLLGFAPFYAKLLSNCAARYNAFCIIDPAAMKASSGYSVAVGARSVRVRTSTYADFFGTEDEFLTRLEGVCSASLGPLGGSEKYSPVSWLARCYIKYPLAVLPVLLKKVTAGFDNYFLNAYATDQTNFKQFWLNHIFSLMGFLGFCAALAHCSACFFRRALGTQLHLLVGFMFVGFHTIPHIESRYFFPVQPLFLLFFLGSLRRLFQQTWTHKLFKLGSYSALTGIFLIQTHYWNLTDCIRVYGGFLEERRTSPFYSMCPTVVEATAQQAKINTFIPRWPSP